ncbi:hypothetical protein CDV31_009419 [Fusarium ambrosium]|uniref:Uncharacterized protein n=1 Tax=Fusarium ambrosium TaxID=131363 RepID=A0A428TUY1_9HYPO|nr:hypothetical protein CDV31_009419 [Fusarium ambrosium]
MGIPTDEVQPKTPLPTPEPVSKSESQDERISLPANQPLAPPIQLPLPDRDESPSPLTYPLLPQVESLAMQPPIPEEETLALQAQPPPLPPRLTPTPEPEPEPVSHKLPHTLNLYRYKGNDMPEGTYTLGERESQPLYLCKANRRFLGLLSSPMVIYSGPTDADPPLAYIKISGWSCTVSEVKVNSFRGGQHFTIESGTSGNEVKEEFEWRPSKSNAVAGLGGQRRGWKLVRLARGPPGGADMDFLPGNIKDSYGKEIVAVWTEAKRNSTEIGHFRFLGTGVTGALGDKWAIMAIITALALLEQDRAIAQRAITSIFQRKT